MITIDYEIYSELNALQMLLLTGVRIIDVSISNNKPTSLFDWAVYFRGFIRPTTEHINNVCHCIWRKG